MATDEDETPRAMIGQFIQRHQSSKSTRIAPGRGLHNRPRSSSLGVDEDKGTVVEVYRVGQRTATNARLSTSEFTPHNTIEQFLKVSKTTEPTRRKRDALSHTPAASQASGESALSSQRSSGAVGRLRSATAQSHKPTPRSIISAFIDQGVEETPVAAPITNNSSTFDETIPGSEAAPKRRKSIREESFLQHLEVENEDALPKRSRFVPTRPRLSAFDMASKFTTGASKKGSRNALSVTAEIHNPPRTPMKDVALTDDSPSSSLVENRTGTLDEIQEDDEHEVSFPDVAEVRQLSRRSTRIEAMSVSLQALTTTPSPRPSPSNTSIESPSPSHSMKLRRQESQFSQRTLMAPALPIASVSRTSNTPMRTPTQSRSMVLRQQGSSQRTLMGPPSPRNSVLNTPMRSSSPSHSVKLRQQMSSLSPRSPRTLVTPASQRGSTSRMSNTRMTPPSPSRSMELRRQRSSLSQKSPRTLGKSQNVSKSSASRNVSLSVRRTSSAANATLEKTATSVTRRSASVVRSFVAPMDSNDAGEQEESSQEDVGRVTEGIGSEELDEAENTAEEINYNKRLLSFFQETRPTEPGDVYGNAETVAVNDADENDDDTVGGGHVADDDSQHGDDPVHGQRSQGDVSAGDRLTAAVRRTETPNIFEAAKERRNVKITPSRSASGSKVKKVIQSEPWLWEKKGVPSNASRRNVAATVPVLQGSQNATAASRKRKTSDPSRPRLPASLTRSIFSHFSRSRVSKATMDEVEKVADVYWKNVVSDLSAYVKHADRGTLLETDVEMLLKRQRFVTDKTTMYTLVEKHLTLEYRQEIIPMARTGNKVVPKH